MTHTPASELWQMPAPMFAAFEDEAGMWDRMDDMVALQTEVMHGFYRLLVGTLTKSNAPEQLRIPRPGAPDRRRIVLTAGDMARALTKRVRGVDQ
jgi:hypothetical protein